MSTLATQKSHREEEEDMPDMQLSLNMHELDVENCKNKRKMNPKAITAGIQLTQVTMNRVDCRP